MPNASRSMCRRSRPVPVRFVSFAPGYRHLAWIDFVIRLDGAVTITSPRIPAGGYMRDRMRPREPVPGAQDNGPTGPSNKTHHGRVLLIIGLAQLMVVLDTTIVNIALPSAQSALGFSTESRQWIVTAYSLAFGALLLIGGRLSDIIGRRRTLLIGLLGFAAASAVGGAAVGFGMLVAARTA